MNIKSKILSVFLALVAVFSYAQKITIMGKVAKNTDPEVAINLPVNGQFFGGNNQSVKVENGQYRFETELKKAGFVTLSNNFYSVSIYAEPQKNYIINFNENTIDILGDDAEKQQLLQKLGIFEDGKSTSDAEARKTLAEKEQYYAKIQEDRLNLLRNNAEKLNINPAQLEKFSNLIKINVLDEKSADFYFTFRLFYEQDLAKRPEFLPIYQKAWEEIYTQIFSNPELDKYLYISPLLDRQKGLEDIKQTGTLQFSNEKKLPFPLAMVEFYQKNIPSHWLENAWANRVYQGITEYKFEPQYLENYQEFEQKYPHSPLLPLLKPFVKKVEDYHKKDKTTEITYVPNYTKINTLKELFALYKDKVIYVDMWATWCAPCRTELQFSKKNHHQLEQMGVTPIYLSVDDDRADALWKKMTKNLELEGIHARANAKLRAEINKLLKNGIPYYMIVKNGEVAVYNAKRPSDQQELFDQLAEVLK